MTTDLAVMGADGLAISADQVRFSDMQVATLRQLGIEDAPQGDLDLFFHVCKKTNLDPFRKQIFMIGRNTKVTTYEPNADGTGQRRVERWVTKYTIQTGIKGYRKRAREVATALGDKIGLDGPYWCGEDGQWREVWPEDKVPTAAKFVVFRNGELFSAVCHFSEYVQTVRIGDNDVPNSMWAKMPRNQIAKCAEAAAYERAYPDDFDGLVLDIAAQPTVIDADGSTAGIRSSGAPRRGLAGARAAVEGRGPSTYVINADVAEPEPVAAETPKRAKPVQQEPQPADVNSVGEVRAAVKLKNLVIKALAAETYTNPKSEETLAYVGQAIERPISDLKDLSAAEANTVLELLNQPTNNNEGEN